MQIEAQDIVQCAATCSLVQNLCTIDFQTLKKGTNQKSIPCHWLMTPSVKKLAVSCSLHIDIYRVSNGGL